MTEAIDVESYSKKSLLVLLVDDTQYDKWDKLLCKIGATRNNSDNSPGWILPKTKIEDLENLISEHGSREKRKQSSRKKEDKQEDKREDRREDRKENKREDKREKYSRDYNKSERKGNANSSDSGHSSGDSPDDDMSGSDTDDELIQSVLSKRLMSESSQKSIPDEQVENSDLEDVVSSMRRFRHIYAELKQLRNRVSELEKEVNSGVPSLDPRK